MERNHIDPETDAAAWAEATVDALHRVLDSSLFAKAEQSRRFLAFVAHETLAGRGDRLNERAIARVALGRPAGVDVRHDPSVRILAGRLRTRLGRYYLGDGSGDPFRISIPLGQYAVRCSLNHSTGPVGKVRPADAPMIAVTRFKSGGRGSPSVRIAAGVSESLVYALTRFPGVRVAGPLMTGATSEAIDAIGIGARTTARYALFGRVRDVEGLVRVNVHLVETAHGEVVWSQQLDVDTATDNGFGAEDELVARLAAEVADHHGVALRAPIGPIRLSEEPASYRAITGYYQFVDSLDPAQGQAVRDELERAAAAEPSNVFLVGVLASAHSVAVLMRGAAGAPESLARAEDLGRLSLRLDPGNPYAHQALATTALAQGDPSACRAHLAALLESVPHHPSFLSRAGLLTAGSGQWDEGVAIIRRAIRLNPHHPSHFRTMLVIDGIRRGDFAAGLAEAQLIRFEGYIWAPLCFAICLMNLGMTDQARLEVASLLQTAPDFFDRPRDIIAVAVAIPDDVVELLVRHIDDLAKLGPVR